MTTHAGKGRDAAIREAAGRLREAAASKKCWSCGCLHNSLAAIERAFPEGARPPALHLAIVGARERLGAVRYDCPGCEVCCPALAVNALDAADPCPSGKVEPGNGWPPLPGSCRALRYRAPMAVCTLTDDQLMRRVAREAPPEVGIVGTLHTENLGIERIIVNLLANPYVRFLLVCGPDSRQAIGHLPGQSLLALARSGLDERQRIIGARGRRPFIRNISREAVERFRGTVEVIDLVGQEDGAVVMRAIAENGKRDPGPAAPSGTICRDPYCR